MWGNLYNGKELGLKDPKGERDWVKGQYALSYEISCNLILHPNILNYIGGVRIGTKQKIH